MKESLQLLPRPRQVRYLEDEVEIRQLPVREMIAPEEVREAGEEAYRLIVGPDMVSLIARTETGLRWGRATLAQLCVQGRVPCLEIDDAPLFAHRGVMLDISRDRVPTLNSLFTLVDQLASWKMNHLQLYVEHTIAYAGHEEVWRNASAVTPEEFSVLDAYCRSKGISLNANQNCLGHFERWLKHERYAPLGELDTGHLIRDEWYVRPNTLCPEDPRVLPLLQDLLSQQLPLCSGEFANIGCDEPWDLGMGRSRAACETEGKGRVFSRHVSKVAELVRQLGKRPQYWCDPEPNEDDGLPRDLVALIWGYEEESDLHGRAAAHLTAGREVWVAPGTGCWRSYTGRTWNRRGNLDHAAVTPGAAGFLCTAWGDEGHRQPWPVTLLGFADAAMAAWSGPGMYEDAAAGLHAFGTPEIGPWLARLGNVDAELCRGERPTRDGNPPPHPRVGNSTALWQEMETQLFDPRGNGTISDWEEVGDRLAELRQNLPADVSSQLADECRFALDVSEWIVDRAILRRKELTREGRKALAARMAVLIDSYRQQWVLRSRPGGLEDSINRLIPHAARW